MGCKMASVLALFLIFSLNVYASVVDCPRRYPNGNTLAYDDGTLRFPNGNTLRYSDGTFRYPNGNTFRYSDGTFRYPNGNTLRYSDGTFRYANGNTARYSDGTLRDPNGNTNHTGSLTISSTFGEQSLHVRVRPQSAHFQTSVAYGNDGIVILDIDEEGNVVCTVEGGGGPSEFRVEGSAGSAFVTVKPGKDPRAVKAAIQRALDSL